MDKLTIFENTKPLNQSISFWGVSSPDLLSESPSSSKSGYGPMWPVMGIFVHSGTGRTMRHNMILFRYLHIYVIIPSQILSVLSRWPRSHWPGSQRPAPL